MDRLEDPGTSAPACRGPQAGSGEYPKPSVLHLSSENPSYSKPAIKINLPEIEKFGAQKS